MKRLLSTDRGGGTLRWLLTLALFLGAFSAHPAMAQNNATFITVTNSSDNPNNPLSGSLRAAINQANAIQAAAVSPTSPGTTGAGSANPTGIQPGTPAAQAQNPVMINFAANLNQTTIFLLASLPTITGNNITINGPTTGITIDGGGRTLGVRPLNIAGGTGPLANGQGGNQAGGQTNGQGQPLNAQGQVITPAANNGPQAQAPPLPASPDVINNLTFVNSFGGQSTPGTAAVAANPNANPPVTAQPAVAGAMPPASFTTNGGVIDIAPGANVTGGSGTQVVIVTNSTFLNNSSGNGASGGAIADDGNAQPSTLNVNNCTFSGNAATAGTGGGGAVAGANGNGGGIFAVGPAVTTTLTNCTFTNNTASGNNGGNGSGGAFFVDGGTGNIFNSILYGDTATKTGTGTLAGNNEVGTFNGATITVAFSDILLTTTQTGNGLPAVFNGTNNANTGPQNGNIDQNPLFAGATNNSSGQPANYGGPNKALTLAILPGSPALNTASFTLANAQGLTSDERGVTYRAAVIAGGAPLVDMGSFESSGFTVSINSGNNQSTPVNTSFGLPLVVTVTSINPSEPVTNGIIPGVVQFTSPANNLQGPANAQGQKTPTDPSALFTGGGGGGGTANGQGNIGFAAINPTPGNIAVGTASITPVANSQVSAGVNNGASPAGQYNIVADTRAGATNGNNLLNFPATGVNAGTQATPTTLANTFVFTNGPATTQVGLTSTPVVSATQPDIGPNRSLLGQPVNFTVTVTPQGQNPKAPTGTVILLDGGRRIGSGTLQPIAGNALAQSQVVINITTLQAGNHNITAQFVGPDNNNASGVSAPLLQMVIDPLLVTNLGDRGNIGDGSLRGAVAYANGLPSNSNPPVIRFQTGLSGTIALISTPFLNGELVPQRPMTIQGPGAPIITIDGGFRVNTAAAGQPSNQVNGTRIFRIAPGNAFNNSTLVVNINNLTLVSGSGLSINNTGDNNGGAVENFGTLTMQGCAFNNNRVIGQTNANAEFRGGFGGAVFSETSASTTLIACMFTGNSANTGNNGANPPTSSGGNGGAVYNDINSALLLSACTLVSNTADPQNGAGGGLLNFGRATVTGCSFTQNVSGVEPSGAISNIGTLSLTDDILFNDRTAAGVVASEVVNNGGTFTANFSDIQTPAGVPTASGQSNLNADPLFVAAPGNLRVAPTSPVVGAGNADPNNLIDVQGTPRFSPPTIGAFEQPGADVTKSVTILGGATSRNRNQRNLATQQVTITNSNPNNVPLTGPFSLVLDNLSNGQTPNSVILTNQSGTTGIGSPFINVPNGSSLAPGKSITVTLQFAEPVGQANPISFTPRLIAGSGSR